LVILVGGVAQGRSRPYGYVVTWSVGDLLEEYVRPARIVREGRAETVPVFSGYERVVIEGAGEMEAFYSDGLRTLIETMPGVREMGEKTLRWPGHVEAVRPLLESNRLVEELRARCTRDPAEDLVVLRIEARWNDVLERTTLIDRYDPVTGWTAMSRTTALTTSAVAQMLASGLPLSPGIRPLEQVAREPGAFDFVRETLARRGVQIVRGDRAPAP